MSDTTQTAPHSTFADFDADAIAGELPRIRIGAHWFTGRVLSIVEWLAFRERLLAQEARERAEGVHATPETLAASRAICAEFLRAIFAPTRVRWWHLRPLDPIAQLERHAPHVLEEAFTSFFVHHALSMTRRRMVQEALTPGAPTDATTKSTDASPKSSASPSSPSASSATATLPAPGDSKNTPTNADGISSPGGTTNAPSEVASSPDPSSAPS